MAWQLGCVITAILLLGFVLGAAFDGWKSDARRKAEGLEAQLRLAALAKAQLEFFQQEYRPRVDERQKGGG